MNILAKSLVLFSFLTAPLYALAPDQSSRPILRPMSAKEVVVIGIAPARSLRPKWRVKDGTTNRSTIIKQSSAVVVDREKKRPGLLKRLLQKPERQSANGSICGVNGIKGQTIKPITSRVSGCGVERPVQVSSVAGVRLSSSAVMDCGTAKALFSWVNDSVKPTFKRKGGGVHSLQVAAHYACRTRNNRKGARISEHGKGRAIDISAINLKNGDTLTVLKDWRSRHGRAMRKIHKAACGPFGTVLGPQSDRYHRDHFHFDTARYRSGPYCR